MNPFENSSHPIDPILRLLDIQYDSAIAQGHDFIGMELAELIIKIEYQVKMDLHPFS